MHEGPEQGNEGLTPAQERLIRSWKEGPVILASGSSLKLEKLRELGMKQATSIAVPEEAEDTVFQWVEGRTMHMHEMVAAMVAQEKVAHVVEGGVPDDALVCGFDTVVMETTGTLETKKHRYLQKPETREQATSGLIEYFTNLVEEKICKDEITKELIAEAPGMPWSESIESLLSVGYPQTLVHITTGMAVRLPNGGDEIDMIPTTIRLTPTVLQGLSTLDADKRQERIEDLVEKALTIMDENERWRSITTGIDYSDFRIIELLGLREAKIFDDMDESEIGVMKGMPQEAFDRYLRLLAKVKTQLVGNAD